MSICGRSWLPDTVEAAPAHCLFFCLSFLFITCLTYGDLNDKSSFFQLFELARDTSGNVLVTTNITTGLNTPKNMWIRLFWSLIVK